MTPSEAARLLADPEEPIAFGATVEELLPPADATNGLRPVPFPTIPIAVLAIALASLSSAVIWLPEFRTIQEMLATFPGIPSIAWNIASVIAIAERLKIDTLATTDRRHFTMVRPAHVERLTLVP